jgi:hypothetical protein
MQQVLDSMEEICIGHSRSDNTWCMEFYLLFEFFAQTNRAGQMEVPS